MPMLRASWIDDPGGPMNYLRRLQSERPVLFWAVTLVGFWLAFRLVLLVASLLLGPFGLPSWAPLVVVVAVLVIIARRQQGPR
jgi:cbb3-type cytochrome oxidase subunit 1